MSARKTLWRCMMAAAPSKTLKPSSVARWPMMWCSITAWGSSGCGLMKRADSAAFACSSPPLLTVSPPTFVWIQFFFVQQIHAYKSLCWYLFIFFFISFWSFQTNADFFFFFSVKSPLKINHYEEFGPGWEDDSYSCINHPIPNINRGRFDFYVLVAVDLISPKYYSHLHRHKVMLIYDVRAFILHQ